MLNRAKASRSPTAFISSVCKSVYGLPYLFCRHPIFPRFFYRGLYPRGAWGPAYLVKFLGACGSPLGRNAAEPQSFK
jgi:hypothetical protein